MISYLDLRSQSRDWFAPQQIEVLSAVFYVPDEAAGLDTQFDDMLTMEEELR
jgi:hypothetical protein